MNIPAPAHVNKLSWVAGVLDVSGRFRFRMHKEQPYATLVWVTCEQAVGEKLTDVLGLGQWENGKWMVSAIEQGKLLGRIIPYMQTQQVRAGRIYQWRLTSDKRRESWKLVNAVKKFRRLLAEDVEMSGTQG